MNGKKAFTLAEVLITMTIIGVIAALTIPNLMQKYTEQATVKKVQKFYSNLSNAYSLAMKDNGIANEWGLTGSDETSNNKIYEILFKPYFKIDKNCGNSNTGKCITSLAYKQLNNTTHGTYSGKGYYKVVLNDGATIWWRGASEDYLDVIVFYDINGAKEPNQWGRDLFEFAVLTKSDRIIPSGIESGKYSYAKFSSWCNKDSAGLGCAAWVVYKGNMDYLHCNDLSWDGKDKCSK